MLVQNLSFARPSSKKPSPPLFSVIGGGKRRQDVLPASLFAVFRISGLFSCIESEIRAGKLLFDPGHLQEELVGGRPHHFHRRVRRGFPAVDRALQKNIILMVTIPTK
jgi:hypothetical protein